MSAGLLSRIPPAEASAAFARARAAGILDDEDTTALFIDLARLAARARALQEAFPAGALHAAAVKADPLPRVLERLHGWGLGLEAASAGELEAAARVAPPERIVFDSPAKTRAELARALDLGVSINADSLSELERLAQLLADPARRAARERDPREGGAFIGLRVNPQIGVGRFAYTSTAARVSKFGVPIEEFREALLEAYLRHAWLRGMHVHIGSQACPPEMMVAGLRLALDFALEVNRRAGASGPRVQVFDIGGGLPVAYGAAETPLDMEAYAALLRARCPELFTGEFRLVTEFGRYLHANSAWAASRVEYVKPGGGARTLILQVGADMLLRECYFPEHWKHEMDLLDPRGALREGPRVSHVVAGPLCFAGDIISPSQELPEAREGDFVLIHDVGAYTFAMWSRFVSRPFPKVIGYEGPEGALTVLKPREPLERVLAFWE